MGHLAMAQAAAPKIREKVLSGRSVAGYCRLVVVAALSWAERARQRRQLLDLDDRLLRDVGLTRRQVDRECTKPFWRP